MLKEKIPPGYIKLQDLPKKIKEMLGSDISYRGIRNYINTGLVPKPEKFKGYRDKYFMISDIAAGVWGVKYCSVLFEIRHNELGQWMKKVPGLVETLPGEFIFAYSNYWRLRNKEQTVGEIQTLNILLGAHLYFGAVMKVLMKHKGKIKPLRAESEGHLRLFPYPDKTLELIYARANKIFYKDFENAMLDVYAPVP